MEEKQEVIMAIGGHVGDAELTSGGVLASMALQGHKIITVALTGGERGNPPHLSVTEYRKQKEREAAEFASMLNGEAVVLPYRDGELPDDQKVRFELCDIIRKYKPNVLLTHWKNSIHRDHMITHKIVKDAQFYAGLASIERELPAHYAAGPYYAENWEDATDFVPYTYVEVTPEGYELWQRAIQKHWFAVNSTSFKYMDYYSHLMIVRGHLARKAYAEAFAVDEEQKKIVWKSF